jgi:hypothetical protein
VPSTLSRGWRWRASDLVVIFVFLRLLYTIRCFF